MYSIGQTLRKKNTNKLVLYLGKRDGWVYLISEAGKLNPIAPSEFRLEYTHIIDEFKMPVVGVHAQNGNYFGFWNKGQFLKPDLRLRGYFYVDDEDCEILREGRIGKIILRIQNFIKSNDTYLNLSAGDSAYKSDYFWKFLENIYPHFKFRNLNYYLMSSNLIVRDQRHILEKVPKKDCEEILRFMKKHLNEIA